MTGMERHGRGQSCQRLFPVGARVSRAGSAGLPCGGDGAAPASSHGSPAPAVLRGGPRGCSPGEDSGGPPPWTWLCTGLVPFGELLTLCQTALPQCWVSAGFLWSEFLS